jgi:hypothetical protein
MSLEGAIDRLRLAEADWTDALDAHLYAEPNPGFAHRLRAMADAAQRQQAAFEYAAGERLAWDPLPHEPEGRPAPHELSLDSGRVGPSELWERFDRVFVAWDRSLEQTSIAEIAQRFGELAAACRELADAVDLERGVIPPERGVKQGESGPSPARRQSA